MSLDKVEEKRDGLVDYMGNLPNELLLHVLSYLSFEETDNLRLINQKFNGACNYLLKKNYRDVKRQVALCQEKARSCLIKDQINSSKFYYEVNRTNYITRIFWFAVSEFLDNSFRLFDPLKGYLDKEYLVNGKTLDVVRQILWLKETNDPFSLLAEMILGRSRCHSNMKCLEDYMVAYSKWYFVKKYRGLLIEEIYVPMISGKEPGLDLPKYIKGVKNQCYAMVLDMLSTLWSEEFNTKQHRVFPSPLFFISAYDLKEIPVSKLGQNQKPQLDEDSDVDDNELPENDNNFQRANNDDYKWNFQLDLAFTIKECNRNGRPLDEIFGQQLQINNLP